MTIPSVALPQVGSGDPLLGPHGPIGVLVCGHGSRNRLAVEEFASLARQLQHSMGRVPVEYGYLEFARPILRDGLDALRRRGVNHVLAIPAMLFAAGHAKNDIPSVLNTYSAETGLRIDYGRELGVDRRMIQAAGARIRACLDQADREDQLAGRPPLPIDQTLLVVVGRGSSDPDANSNVSKVTRLLVEGFGFGWGETVYSGVTFPLVEPGLRHVVKLGYRRIVVFPYFLFSGVLVSRIVQHSQRVAADHPDVQVLQASYLGDHPEVLATFRDRVEDVLRGDTDMNCSLCKYRAQVLGFEVEVGAPQHSHHHHVEGLVESCTLCERECTGACQEDGVALPGSAQPQANGAVHDHGHDHGHGHGHGHGHDRQPDHGPGPGLASQQLPGDDPGVEPSPADSPRQEPAEELLPPNPGDFEPGHEHDSAHSHEHEHGHGHGHHHAPYPHADQIGRAHV